MPAAPAFRIALIEEDPELLPALRHVLDDHHLVDAYGSAATALAGLRRRSPDLVVLSTTIEDTEWPELLAHVPRGVPVVALSFSNEESERERCLQAGCADHLIKPIGDSDLLLASIATCLERARAERKGGPRPRHEQRRRKQ